MTLVTKATDASIDAASALYAPQISGQTAGEALDAFAPCYIKQSDGLIYMSNATNADEAAGLDGFTARAYAVGDSNVTLFGRGLKMRYATGMTPGAMLYIGATAGRLNDAVTTGDGAGVARVVSATVIRVIRDIPLSAVPDGSIVAADLANGAVTLAKAKVFFSTEQTGTGSAQNIAHGLGVTPTGILIAPTDLTPATVGSYVVTEGAHTSTNVVVTVTTSKKFKVIAWA
jgi:hypothetical protein